MFILPTEWHYMFFLNHAYQMHTHFLTYQKTYNQYIKKPAKSKMLKHAFRKEKILPHFITILYSLFKNQIHPFMATITLTLARG